MKVQFKGREIDLAVVVPLKIRDWKLLEKKGVTPNGLSDTKINDISILAHYVLSKADPTVTEEDIDGLTLDELVSILRDAKPGESVIDRPTLTPSTSSEPSTVGEGVS